MSADHDNCTVNIDDITKHLGNPTHPTHPVHPVHPAHPVHPLTPPSNPVVGPGTEENLGPFIPPGTEPNPNAPPPIIDVNEPLIGPGTEDALGPFRRRSSGLPTTRTCHLL